MTVADIFGIIYVCVCAIVFIPLALVGLVKWYKMIIEWIKEIIKYG